MSWFEAAVEGEDDFTQSELHCCLKDGVLKSETNVNNTEDDDQAYKEYILTKVPYEKFADIYGIKADSLSEEDYEDFINDLIIDCCESEYTLMRVGILTMQDLTARCRRNFPW